ncbi:hypothetical protein [Arthrobacter cryoconiti]|uniref:Uncharacterized protein n=1 Tax=Arthrobacter cryoconiti TaxID=748907 RepID=A0ABV8QZN6_9MICC|nr:hypothetical protein [Arthrobacter cryoconiti]MCC9068796.1 hypothetical protein [Arthrobacter cryoconiti]
MPSLTDQLFGSTYTQDLRQEDVSKANALLAVVCKSTASLSDVITLANALELDLSIQAKSRPSPVTEAPKES